MKKEKVDIIYNIIKYTEEDKLKWDRTFVNGNVNTYETSYDISPKKIIKLKLKSTSLKTPNKENNRIDFYFEKIYGNGVKSIKLLFIIYFQDYKDLFFLAKLIRYKLGEDIDPYLKRRKDLIDYIDHLKEQLGYIIVNRQSKKILFQKLKYFKNQTMEADNIDEFESIENSLYILSYNNS
jgi:hypothetical protein